MPVPKTPWSPRFGRRRPSGVSMMQLSLLRVASSWALVLKRQAPLAPESVTCSRVWVRSPRNAALLRLTRAPPLGPLDRGCLVAASACPSLSLPGALEPSSRAPIAAPAAPTPRPIPRRSCVRLPAYCHQPILPSASSGTSSMRLPRRMALRSPRPPRWRLRPRLRVMAPQRLLIISQRPLSRLSPWARQPLRLPVRSVCLRAVRRENLGSRQGGRGAWRMTSS